MYYVYIIQSEVDSSYYIGQTSDLDERLHRHNTGRSRSTKSKIPWKLVYSEEFESRGAAMSRERQIKSYKGGEAFEKLLRSG